MNRLIFIKLGGSLITDKTRPFTPRKEKIKDLVEQIADVVRTQTDLQLLLGHGSGSFGHTAAKQYGTRHGVQTADQWFGFSQVWFFASTLNRLLCEYLQQAGLPAIGFPPSAGVTTKEGRIHRWDILPIQKALRAGLLPVVYGDVAFDEQVGGTIISTEELFIYLSGLLRPHKILLLGLEPGVWADFPNRKALISNININKPESNLQNLYHSSGIDVTGGMFTKVLQMMKLVEQYPELEVQIFSGEQPGTILQVIQGGSIGTRIFSED